MCHLLTDSSPDNQKIAYQMLQQAAATRTEHLVVEAAVDSENVVAIELPHELVILLQSSVNFDDTEVGGQDPLAYLLGWMITFDLFVDAVSSSVFVLNKVIETSCVVTEGQDRLCRPTSYLGSHWRLLLT